MIKIITSKKYRQLNTSFHKLRLMETMVSIARKVIDEYAEENKKLKSEIEKLNQPLENKKTK